MITIWLYMIMYVIFHDSIWSHMILYHYVLIGFLVLFDPNESINQTISTRTPKRCPRSSLQRCPRRRCHRSNHEMMVWDDVVWNGFSVEWPWCRVMLQFLSQSGSCIMTCSRSSVFWFPGGILCEHGSCLQELVFFFFFEGYGHGNKGSFRNCEDDEI